MWTLRRSKAAIAAAGLVLGIGGHAHGEEPSATGAGPERNIQKGAETAEPATDEDTRRFRAAFEKGVQASKKFQWSDALGAFEEASKIRDLPIVRYNIGFAQQGLGHYVDASFTLKALIARPGEPGAAGSLGSGELETVTSILNEIERYIVKVRVTLKPAPEEITVNGRPLKPASGDGKVFIVQRGKATSARPPSLTSFALLLDPGLHLFRATRAGHEDALKSETYKPGEKSDLDLSMSVLPAVVHVTSLPVQSRVRIDGVELGSTPAKIERPAGRYHLEVTRGGYETHAETVTLQAGQRLTVTPKLVPESITKRWWFWMTLGGIAASVGTTIGVSTYLASRQPPPYDGGSLNWVMQPIQLRP